jgi:nucleoside-diphosphate-sugar epimerase
MMLPNKNALILGAGGAIGSSVARRLTAEGARVFCAGRTASVLEDLAAEIDAPWERVDGTDEAAVSTWVDRVAHEAGGIDVCLTPEPDRGLAVPHCTSRGSAHGARGRGTIVFLSASLNRAVFPYMSGITAASGAR